MFLLCPPQPSRQVSLAAEAKDERVLAIIEVRDRSSYDICFSFVAADAEVYVFDYVALGADATVDNDGNGRSTNRCAYV